MQTTSEHASQAISAERRFKELGIHLCVPPETFGTYAEVVFLSVSVATEGNVRGQPKVADGASEFPEEVSSPDKNPTRLVYAPRLPVFHLEPLSRWS